MTRTRLTDLTIASAIVLAVASLVVADTGVTIPTECPKTDVGDVSVNLAHETDCTKYYGCSAGKKWLKECPLIDAQGNRLHFNPELQVCDWPNNVNCKLPNGRSAVMLKTGVRSECPKIDPLNETVHIAHETDCTKFYTCSNGVKYEMDCPVFDDEGHKLYFNEILQVCDWPKNVDCKKSETPDVSRKVLTPRKLAAPMAEIPTKCPKIDPLNETVHIAHETDCTKFYTCSNGVKYEMDCPVFDDEGHKLYFNEILQVCDWPKNVDCKKSKTPDVSRKVLTPRKLAAPMAETPTKCPKIDPLNETVHIAHETDCTKFYTCSNGVKYEMDCPVFDDEGHKLYFNEILQACDWPKNVDCKKSETPDVSRKVLTPRKLAAPMAETPTKCPKIDPLNETVHIAHETDCTKFYTCSNGVKYEMDCPVFDDEGHKLYFNEILQVCDWPKNVDCKNSETPDVLRKGLTPRKLAAPMAETPTKCPKIDPLNETVHIAHETDCTKFYTCSNGVKYEMDCPVFDDEGHKLYFNEILQVCDWPKNVDCKNSETPDVLRKGLTPRKLAAPMAETPTKCPKIDPLNETVHIAHETDCTKFYTCSNGVKYEMDCPVFDDEGHKLYFNEILQVCDWPKNVDCKKSETPDVLRKVLTPRKLAAPMAETPTKCPKIDPLNETVHIAHETDCTKFYTCSNGVKYEMDCPVFDDEGHKLYFNEILQVCDWPKNVDCKKSETPDVSRKVLTPRKLAAPMAEIPTKCPKIDPLNETVHIAHETDCTKFYTCSNGVKYEMDCPVFDDEGHKLYFNEILQVCDWPKNVDCKKSETPDVLRKVLTPRELAAPMAEIPTKCPKVDQENQTVHLAHESDCTKFYKCSHGEKYEMDCPVFDEEGHKLYFNAALQLCDWPGNVDCTQNK